MLVGTFLRSESTEYMYSSTVHACMLQLHARRRCAPRAAMDYLRSARDKLRLLLAEAEDGEAWEALPSMQA